MRMKTDPTHPMPPQPATSQVVLDTPSPRHGQVNHLPRPQQGSGTDGGQCDRQLRAQRSRGHRAGTPHTGSDTELILPEDCACGIEFIFNILCFISPSLLG